MMYLMVLASLEDNTRRAMDFAWQVELDQASCMSIHFFQHPIRAILLGTYAVWHNSAPEVMAAKDAGTC
jgi:hypothetical protein